MQFCAFECLVPEAQEAMRAGNGIHGRFVVDDRYIAYLDNDGRPCGWTFVTRPDPNSQPIVGIPADED